jgi:peptide/nickel transport system substrate-binding protein
LGSSFQIPSLHIFTSNFNKSIRVTILLIILNKTSIVIISMLFFLGISGCIDEEIENKTDEFDLNIAYGQDVFNGFYPWVDFINTQTLSINSNIFNSLVEFGERYQIIPSLVESWNNPNNLTWRFYLRKDVKFHNGDNFSADDVKYSIELIKGDKNNTLYNYLTMVKEVIIVNDFTVDIVTLEPYPLLLNKLVYIFMVSKQNHEEISNGNPIGTGAYRFSEYLKDNYLVLERFEGYWGKKPEFQKVTFKFFNDYEDQLNNFLEGNVDIINSIDPNDYDNLSKIPGVKILPFTFNTVTYLGFNFVENNPFLDLRVRKAVYHAINIDEIIENALDGYAEPASQFVTQDIFGYNPEIKRLSYDLKKARQYMKDAGYEEGFEITLDCRESEIRENASRMIADQLSLINITVEVNILSSSDFYSKISNRESSFYFFGWATDSADAGEIFDNILRSVDFENGFGLSNFGNYSNQVIDEIAEDISYNMNPEARLHLMKEGFAIAMEDVVCVPLYILKGYCVVRDEFSLPIRADGLIKIENVKIDN